MRGLLVALLLVLAAAISPPALAQQTPPEQPEQTTATTNEVTPPNAQNGPQVLPESGQAIVKLFILAVLLESALALLFNWRPFVATLDGRAVKPLISFGAALIVVFAFGLDDLEELLEAYGSSPITGDGERVSQIIEAMIIAGGSNGVNTMLRTLGFRAIPSAEAEPLPPPSQAWLSVSLHRVNAVGPVQVVAAPGGELGTIHGTMRKRGLASFFLRDRGRLPQSGGKPVKPDSKIAVTVKGFDAQGAALPSPPAQEVTPVAGALIDLEFKL